MPTVTPQFIESLRALPINDVVDICARLLNERNALRASVDAAHQLLDETGLCGIRDVPHEELRSRIAEALTGKRPAIPAGLPALPPVPDGYDAWEYRGYGWASDGPVGAPFGVCFGGEENWYNEPWDQKLGSPEDYICAGNCLHVIVAVKTPSEK